MSFKHRRLVFTGFILFLICVGLWTFRIEILWLFPPFPIPYLEIAKDGERIVLKAYPDIPESHRGVTRALEEAGIPCDVVCLVDVGETSAAVLSMRDWSFWEKRRQQTRFWGGSDPGPLLLVPVHAILEAFDVVGQPTNEIASSIVDLSAPLVQPKNPSDRK
ncbi:MAG: hypothetical protein HZC54_24380 [Verrucomicrobia bacterium]|nr:hypothetical protein [Verrucomicrobiota bacterium]